MFPYTAKKGEWGGRQGCFAGVIKLRIFGWGGYPGLSGGRVVEETKCNHMHP